MLIKILAISAIAVMVNAELTYRSSLGLYNFFAKNAADTINILQDLSEKSLDIVSNSQDLTFGVLGLGGLLDPVPIIPVAQAFGNLHGTFLAANYSISKLKPFNRIADQTSVCLAFHNLVIVYQDMLNFVVERAGLLNLLGHGPFRREIITLRGSVRTFANSVVSLAPICAAGARKEINSLDDSFQNAICSTSLLGWVPILNYYTCFFNSGAD